MSFANADHEASGVERSYKAIDAPAHITIEGGVVGNAAFAALFIGLAIASWWLLRRCRVLTDREKLEIP